MWSFLRTPCLRIGLIVAMAVLLPAAAGRAQQALELMNTPKLSDMNRSGWFQSSIVGGRIAVAGRRFGNSVNESRNGNMHEKLTVQFAGRDATVSYQATSPQGTLSVEISGESRVHVTQKPEGESKLADVEFLQDSGELLSLTVGPEDERQTYRAKSIWHLAIAEPEVAAKQLVPILELFSPDVDLAGTAAEVEATLLREAAGRRRPDRDRWAMLVGQLADDQFARREMADRLLRREGRIVVTYLSRIDPNTLDAEQQYRIHRIIQALSAEDGSDTPEQVAGRLAGDPDVWLSLLSRPEETTRRTALEQLQVVLGKPVVFDPAADPSTRIKQIEQVRTLVEER